MRLLVGARIYQALNSIRSATTPPVSHSPVATKRAPKWSINTAPAASSTLTRKRRNTIAPAATVAAVIATSELSVLKSSSKVRLLHSLQLQQLWELSRETKEGHEIVTKKEVQQLKDGKLASNKWVWSTVKLLSEGLEFASIEKLLTVDPQFKFEEGKIPNVRLVSEVLWTAVLAKSLGSPASSILDWIEKAVRCLPEPIPKQKDLIIWLLSIIRGDLPMLQQLQQESSRINGRIGPEIDREKTLRHAALAFLEVGKSDEFRSICTSSGTPLLAEEEQLDVQQSAAMLHHSLLRNSTSGKKDPAMLRWYAESLVSYQRTPIPAEPQFEMMMVPVIRALGGKIEKWRDDDWRMHKLRKWRDDYDDAELIELEHAMRDHMTREVTQSQYWTGEDLSRLGSMLTRLHNEERLGPTVVVDCLNFMQGKPRQRTIDNLLPSCSLVIVGREMSDSDMSLFQLENERIKVLELPSTKERTQGLGHFCALLAVATRGYLLTNDKMREYGNQFLWHLKNESEKVAHATLLKNYLNDAVLMHGYNKEIIQPVVDHSKAAQWIDKEKKELAFTVARRIPNVRDVPFRVVEYYSLHLD